VRRARDPHVFLTLALAVLAGSLAQSVSGIGFGLVCGPLLVADLGPHDGVRLSVALSLAVNLLVLIRDREHADRGQALLLLVPAALVTPLMAAVVAHAPDRVLEAAAGGIAVIGALALGGGLRWHGGRGRLGAVLAGAISGASNVTAGIGGPPVALYAANAGWPAARTRGTLQLFFAGINAAALLSLGLPTVRDNQWLTAAGAMAVGLLLGSVLAPRTPEAVARRITLALAGLGGLAVLVQAVA
jgi:uncharacterized membrane protein YfcA